MVVEVRIDSPCGQLFGTATVDIINGTDFGNKVAQLNINDLNPQFGEISLTDQLNSMEGRIQSLEYKSNSPTVIPEIATLTNSVTQLEATVGNLGDVDITYQNGTQTIQSTVGAAISSIYVELARIVTGKQ